MEKYNVVFVTDERYVQHVAVAMVSLLENNKDINIHLHYIIDSVSEKNQRKLNDIASSYGRSLTFYAVDPTLFESAKTSFHFNKAVYFRLVMAEVLPFKRALYLDADIIVTGSIQYIFDLDLEQYLLAAVANPGFDRHADLGMQHQSKYFNAGVLYVNLEQWRKLSIMKNCLQFMHDNFSKIQLADQDVLNAVVDGGWFELPPKYNLQAVVFESDFSKNYPCYAPADLSSALRNPAIIHYSGTSKPWQLRDAHPLKKLYWKYLMKTPYFPYFPDDLTFFNFIKWLMPTPLLGFIKGIASKLQ